MAFDRLHEASSGRVLGRDIVQSGSRRRPDPGSRSNVIPDPASPSGALPLVIAVTGHRNLVDSELDAIRARTRLLFEELRDQFPASRLTVMSPLADGADMLVAEVALEQSIDLVVPLPKPRRAYLEEFLSDDSRARFESLCERAQSVFEIANDCPPAPEGIDEERWQRDYPYAQLGTFLSAHCHILLAIWDGEPSGQLGGTAQVVHFHRADEMPDLTPSTVSTQQLLVDDESDLVFHIACSREGAEPAPGLVPGEAHWFTNDQERPRSPELPEQHKVVFERAGEFSEDAQRFARRIEAEGWSLLDNVDKSALPEGTESIDRLFRVADWLALHYQQKTLAALRLMHALAFMMGLMFILYSDFETSRILLVAFLGFFALASTTQAIAKRGGWHRKYVDYRTLAEGLRVQFYWAAAGVTHESKWKFAHDTYLRSQNPECGWIRNVMRVAGTRTDATPSREPAGIEFVLSEWVGDLSRGQLGYFRKKALDRLRLHSRTKLMGRLSLGVTVLTGAMFLFVGANLRESVSAVLMVVMGASLLLYAVREGYAYATAVKELIKQYEYMLRIFGGAYRRLSDTTDVKEQRQILFALGQSALDEHSEWLLMHRERLFNDSDIWRFQG